MITDELLTKGGKLEKSWKAHLHIAFGHPANGQEAAVYFLSLKRWTTVKSRCCYGKEKGRRGTKRIYTRLFLHFVPQLFL